MHSILVVEDDLALSQGICLALDSGQLRFTTAATLHMARQCINSQQFDLVILDINLPDGSGLDLLTSLRQTGQTAVILLTANDLETDVVTGFSLGCDDYITKPFSLAILRARVAAQLRRRSGSCGIFQMGPYRFDFAGLEFYCRGQLVELSKTEQRLLKILVENAGRTVSREQLLAYIWPDGTDYVEGNALSVAVKRLRGKLDCDKQIKTVYGIGYSWVVSD